MRGNANGTGGDDITHTLHYGRKFSLLSRLSVFIIYGNGNFIPSFFPIEKNRSKEKLVVDRSLYSDICNGLMQPVYVGHNLFLF